MIAINVRRWRFPVGGCLSTDGSLSAGGRVIDGGSTSTSCSEVWCTFLLRHGIDSGTNMCRGAAESCRWCCHGDLCIARVGGLWHVVDCVWDACSEATWRERSSIHSSNPAVTSNVEGAMLAVVARRVTSQIFSSRWESESSLHSVWPPIIACTCGDSGLVQMVRSNSSGTSGARLQRSRSPISSCERSCLRAVSVKWKPGEPALPLADRKAAAPLFN